MKKRYSLIFLSMVMFYLVSCGKTPKVPDNPDTPVNPDVPDNPDPNPPTPEPPKEPSVIIEEKMSAAVSKANLINGGEVKIDAKTMFSDTSSTSVFEYGESALHYSGVEYGSNFDMYVIKDGDKLVAIKKDGSGKISKPYNQPTEFGMVFENVIGYRAKYYGVENLVSGIYQLGKTNVNKDLKYEISEDTYKVDFGYFESLDAYNYYTISLGFKVGDKEEFKEVSLKVNGYNSDSFLVDSELGVIILNSDATPINATTYTITQTVGNKTFISPYNLEDFKATSYDLAYNGETLTESSAISIAKGEYIDIEIKNLLPKTASFTFDEPVINIKGTAGGINANYSSYSNSFSVSGTIAGDYELNIVTSKISKTIKVTITEAVPKSIGVSYNTETISGYEAYVINDNAFSGYVGVTYIINTSVNPYEASQEVNAYISGVDVSKYKLEKKSITINEVVGAKELWCFTPLEDMTYPITIESSINSEVKTIVNVNTVKAPTFAEVLSSDYADIMSDIAHYLTFTPTGDGNTGSVKIEDRQNNKTGVFNYTISKIEKAYKFNLTHASGDNFTFDLYMNFDYSIVYKNGDFYNTLSKVTNEFLAIGNYSGTLNNDEDILMINLMNNNEASLNFNDNKYFSCNYSIKENSGNYVGTFTSGQYTNNPFVSLPIEFNIDKAFKTITFKFNYESKEYNFTLTKQVY